MTANEEFKSCYFCGMWDGVSVSVSVSVSVNVNVNV